MLTALLLCVMAPLSAAPMVAVTIKPLQLLAAAITDGISQPVLALAPGQDPHHLSLRPSERRTLAQADLILWIGPLLEQPLVGVMDSVDASLLTVQNLEGLILLQAEDHLDPHVWLDTRNARLIAAALAEQLAVLDAGNAAHYHSNLRRFTEALGHLDADIHGKLAGLQLQQWAVYHHAFRYFEQQYALQSPLTLADDHNNPPGIRTVLALQKQLQQGDIHCLLTEPGVNHAELRSMLAPAQPGMYAADVMGLDLAADAKGYTALLQGLGQRVVACLRGVDD
jgi:zinc transport system substrate-binding protein